MFAKDYESVSCFSDNGIVKYKHKLIKGEFDMKKYLVLLLAIFITCTMISCKRFQHGEELTYQKFQLITEKETVFKINEKSQNYKIVLNETENPSKMTIFDTSNNKITQTIGLSVNESFTDVFGYLADVSFDGNLDVVLPYERSASAVYFQAYIYDTVTSQFVYAPSFEKIANFSLDVANRIILGHRTASMITSYSKSEYSAEKKDFFVIASLYFEPAEQENHLNLIEERYDNNGNIINTTSLKIPSKNGIDVDRNDSRVQPYYETQSFWSLNSEKWKNTFYNP